MYRRDLLGTATNRRWALSFALLSDAVFSESSIHSTPKTVCIPVFKLRNSKFQLGRLVPVSMQLRVECAAHAHAAQLKCIIYHLFIPFFI